MPLRRRPIFRFAAAPSARAANGCATTTTGTTTITTVIRVPARD